METKPFWRTSEFWIVVVTNLATITTAIAELLPSKYLAPTLAVTNGLYAVGRGLAKAGVPPTPPPP